MNFRQGIMLRLLTLSSCLVSLGIVTAAMAQVSGPAIPPSLKEKIGPGTTAPPPLAQKAPGHHLALDACQKVIETESAVVRDAVLKSYEALAVRLKNWQAIIQRLEPPLALADALKFVEGAGVDATVLAEMRNAKDVAAMKALATTARDAIKADEVVLASKTRIDVICKAVLAQVTADKEILAAQTEIALAQEKSKIQAAICERKRALVTSYLQQFYAPQLQRNRAEISSHGPDDLKIISAGYGDRTEGPMCDAWSYLHKQCADAKAASASPKAAGKSYCLIERATPKSDDFCGFDPAPRDEKHLVIRYACGGREMRPVVLNGASKYIRLICQYPDPATPTQAETAAETTKRLTELKTFLTSDPCKIDGLP